jgi:hypothetical protein
MDIGRRIEMTLKTKIAIAAGILLAFIATGQRIYIQHKIIYSYRKT